MPSVWIVWRNNYEMLTVCGTLNDAENIVNWMSHYEDINTFEITEEPLM